MTKLAVSFEDIVNAQKRIAGIAHQTPVLTSTTANNQINAKLFFKCENFQRMGAFKFRGAYNAIAQFTPEQKANGVVAFSSGNHAQAIALAAKLLNVKATIIMPHDSPKIKVAATKGYGAQIVFYDRYTEDREQIGAALAEKHKLTLIPPYDHPHVIAGQGTAAKELIDETGPLDVLITPLGGGGLLSGCAVAAKSMNPTCIIYGIEPETGNDGQQSLLSGKIVHIETPVTIADGAQTQHLGKHTFPIVQSLVNDIQTVSDRQLVDTMKFFAERMKIVVEPTGCLGAAAAFTKAKELNLQGKRVGIIISGGNIDLNKFASLIKESV